MTGCIRAEQPAASHAVTGYRQVGRLVAQTGMARGQRDRKTQPPASPAGPGGERRAGAQCQY